MRQIFQLLLVVLTPFVLCEREGSGKGIRATDEDQEGYRVSIQIAVGWLQELADETGEGITNSTLFLPTDAAFKELAEILELDDVEDLFEADPIVRDSSFYVLKNHMIPDNSLVVEALTEGQEIVATTAINTPIKLLKRNDKDVQVEGGGKRSIGRILKPNINMEGDNIVHVVDTVLMPPGYDIYDDFYEDVTRTSIIKRLLEKTGASQVISEATLLAPVDAAWQDLAEEMGLDSAEDLLEDDNVRKIADVLKYHVLPDDKLQFKDIDGPHTSYRTANGRSLTIGRNDNDQFEVQSDRQSTANVVEQGKDYEGFEVFVISNVLLREELEKQ